MYAFDHLLMTFDVYQIATFLLGGGLFVTALKLWAARRKTAAETAKTSEETETIHLTNDVHRLAAIGETNKTIQTLLLEAEATVTKMRETNSQLVAAQTENDFLSTSLGNAKAIIDYQKTERHEWTEQLKKVLAELVEAKGEIRKLTDRVTGLEKINADLLKAAGVAAIKITETAAIAADRVVATAADTKSILHDQPIKVELVEGDGE